MSAVPQYQHSNDTAHVPEPGSQRSVVKSGAREGDLQVRSAAKEASQQALPAPAPPAGGKRDYEMAFELLDSASHSLTIFQERQQQLEAAIQAVTLQSKMTQAAVENAEKKAREWQTLANVMRSQVKDYEERLESMRQRAEISEARAEAEKSRADAAEQKAFSESVLSTRFHDKIVSTFGLGSRAYSALTSIAQSTDPNPEHE